VAAAEQVTGDDLAFLGLIGIDPDEAEQIADIVGVDL
jgi:hypothetical protein